MFLEDVVKVDEVTGLPLDYYSFFAAYRPLILAAAQRLGIPWQDSEDAVQEVQIKFWLKNGLDMYDSNRNTKFATLLRQWASLFLLQERDKSKKNAEIIKHDPHEWQREDEGVSEEFESVLLANAYIADWAVRAEEALLVAGKKHLIPVLHACLYAAEDSKIPQRKDIAEKANVGIHKATALVKELRISLTELGFGFESLCME